MFVFLPLFIAPKIDAQINKYIFPNGLTLLHKENKSNEIVAINLFIKTGRICEAEEQTGITNFVQTLLTKGTRKYTTEQIAEIIESIGGILSTDTSSDFAEVSAMVTSKHFQTAFELLCEVVSNPTFPKKEIEKERSAILASIKARQEDIFTVTFDYFNQNFYGKHPYGLPVVGTEESVKKLKRKDLINHHQKFYAPEKMILVVVGNLSWELVRKTVENLFYQLLRAPDIHPVLRKELSEPVSPTALSFSSGEKIYHKKFKQTYLMIGYPAPEMSSPEYTGLKLLNALLGGGMRGRLFQELREKSSLAYDVSSFYPTRKLASCFVIYLGLDQRRLNEGKEKILEQVGRLKEEPVDKKELEEVKKFIRGNYLIEHFRNRQQAWYLGWWELMGKGYQYDEKYPEELSQITPEQIQTLARKYFAENYLTIIIQPEK